ncbi:MAG: hypothetical protein AAFV53_43075 [Myxococcota bacterium]
MARTKGSRNTNYEARRAELAARALPAFLKTGGHPASFRSLARDIGVDASTLRHYFGDYDGLFQAAFQHLEQGSRVFREPFNTFAKLPPEQGLRDALMSVLTGWKNGMDHLFNVALIGGLGNKVRGPAVVEYLLEPSLSAFDDLLSAYAEQGVFHVRDPRASSLMALTPLYFLLLHQHGLSGEARYPSDIEDYLDQHIHLILRAHQPNTNNDQR